MRRATNTNMSASSNAFAVMFGRGHRRAATKQRNLHINMRRPPVHRASLLPITLGRRPRTLATKDLPDGRSCGEPRTPTCRNSPMRSQTCLTVGTRTEAKLSRILLPGVRPRRRRKTVTWRVAARSFLARSLASRPRRSIHTRATPVTRPELTRGSPVTLPSRGFTPSARRFHGGRGPSVSII